jgi:hypothetical protein
LIKRTHWLDLWIKSAGSKNSAPAQCLKQGIDPRGVSLTGRVRLRCGVLVTAERDRGGRQIEDA